MSAALYGVILVAAVFAAVGVFAIGVTAGRNDLVF